MVFTQVFRAGRVHANRRYIFDGDEPVVGGRGERVERLNRLDAGGGDRLAAVAAGERPVGVCETGRHVGGEGGEGGGGGEESEGGGGDSAANEPCLHDRDHPERFPGDFRRSALDEDLVVAVVVGSRAGAFASHDSDSWGCVFLLGEFGDGGGGVCPPVRVTGCGGCCFWVVAVDESRSYGNDFIADVSGVSLSVILCHIVVMPIDDSSSIMG